LARKDFETRYNNMPELTVKLPDSITEAEAQLMLAMKLYETGRLSCGQAADVAGCTKRTFMELLGKYSIPLFDHPVSDLADDLNDA
jgi:predicted HTH domain antitoxin